MIACGASLAAVVAMGGSAAPPADAGELVYAGCVTGDDPGDPCTSIPSARPNGSQSGLAAIHSLAISGDGKSLYAGSGFACYTNRYLDYYGCWHDGDTARFGLSGPSGSLVYRGCITGATGTGPSGTGACAAIPSASDGALDAGLGDPVSIVVSADGRSAYAASRAPSLNYAGNAVRCVGFSFSANTCLGTNVVTRFDRNPETGALTYRGCVTGDKRSGPSGSGACVQIPSAVRPASRRIPYGFGSGLDKPGPLALSQDGTSLYAGGGDSLAWFDRDSSTGALTYGGCITGNELLGPRGSGACRKIPGPDSAGEGSGLQAVDAIADSGDSVYTAAGATIRRFERDAGSGALTYKGCITGDIAAADPGSAGCSAIPSAKQGSGGVGTGLGFINDLAVSGDGKSVYATAVADDAVARFDRDLDTGALAYRGCYSSDSALGPAGSGVCDEVPGLAFPGSIALSADGRSLYTGSNTELVRFRRDPSSGALTFGDCIAGSLHAYRETGKVCRMTPDATQRASDSSFRTNSIAADPRGRTVYVGGSVFVFIDSNGNVPPSTLSVLAVAPQTKVASGPGRRTTKRRAVLKFRSGERSTFECRLNGKRVPSRLGDWRPCSSEARREQGREKYSGLRRGLKIFRVRATDKGGTTDPTPAKRRWRVKR